MPYYPVNTNKRKERKLTLGQLITMATRLMKASGQGIRCDVWKKKIFLNFTHLNDFLLLESKNSLTENRRQLK